MIRIELLDHYENVLGEITDYISNDDSNNISLNYKQGVQRSCTITLNNTERLFTPNENRLIWFLTKFKIYIGLKVSEDTIYWFSKGVYILTDPQSIRDMSKGTVILNGVDKFGMFTSDTNYYELDGTYVAPAGTTLRNIIIETLRDDLGNGMMIDPRPPIIDREIGMMTLPYDISKPPNSHMGEILVELGNVFACDIFYDADGVLNFTKGNEENDMASFASIWNFSDLSPEYFTPSLNDDFRNTFNIVKVVGNNPNATDIFEYTLKNEQPNSPTRVQLIGAKTRFIEIQFGYNMDRVRDFARYWLRRHCIVHQNFNFQSSFIPHLDINNVVNIDDRHFEYSNQRFIIQSIDMPLNARSLFDINSSNLANIPYFPF